MRNAELFEIDRLANLWYQGWKDAHADILPAELKRLRTLESFKERLQIALDTVRVAGPAGDPLGFCMIKDNELYQLYVSAESRGTGVAAELIADAEDRFKKNGVDTAWLACAIGNYRAARFYEKHGWQRVRTMVNELETSEGIFPLAVWRYEKVLSTWIQ